MSGQRNGGAYFPRNLSLYGYAWNNPVVLRDPDGRAVGEMTAAGCALGGGVGCGVGFAADILTALGYGGGAAAMMKLLAQNKSPYATGDRFSFQYGGSQDEVQYRLQQMDAEAAQQNKPLMNEKAKEPSAGGKSEPTASTERAKNTSKGVPEKALGPSGKPKIHVIDKPNRKAAEDAAKRAGSGKPLRHPNDEGQPPHFHPADRDGNKKPGPHFNYPPKSGYPKR